MKKEVRFLPPVLTLLLMIFALWGCGDTSMLTAFKNAENPTTPSTYSVTYNGNSNTSGSVPTDPKAYHQGDTVTVLGNTGNLVKTGYTSMGWNTAANGSGTTYTQGQTFTMGTSNVTLYAVWATPLYVTNYGSSGPNGISAYTIGSGGALTAITTGTFTTGIYPNGIAISPNGNYLYVTNSSSSSISAYTIGSGGALSPITGTFTTGTGPLGIAIMP